MGSYYTNPRWSQHDQQGLDQSHSIFQSRWSQGPQTMSQAHTPALNPALPSFQPNGMDLQRYQAPRSNVAPQSNKEMQEYFVEMNKSLTVDYINASRRVDQNAQDIVELRTVCGNDIKKLEMQIAELAHGLSRQLNGPSIQSIRTNEDYSPSAAMYDKFSKEQIAHAYLDEADGKQELAEKLREQAELLCPGITEPVSHVKLLEAVPVLATRETDPELACCHIKFFSQLDLRKHMDDVHAKNDSAHGSPARAARSLSRPHAIDIKSPQSSKAGQDQAISIKSKDIPAMKEWHSLPSTTWLPPAIRALPPFQGRIPEQTGTFSFDLIRSSFQGEQWSPGFFYSSEKDCMLPSRGYWMIDAEHEPFVPQAPGEHGAKLTAFFNDAISDSGHAPGPENYLKTPVFIKSSGEPGYKYFGHYSQNRFSDKVSYDTLMEHVPEKVRQAIAEQLSAIGRPDWVTKKLMEQFWPKPVYEGPSPTDSACNTPATTVTAQNSNCGLEKRVQRALEEYAEELKAWEKDARIKVKLITPQALMDAFQDADSDLTPGLRLWWEYLQCEGYDTEFYDMLVQFRDDPKLGMSKAAKGIKRPPTPRLHDDCSTDLKRGAAEIIKGKIVKNSEAGSAKASPASAAKPVPSPAVAAEAKAVPSVTECKPAPSTTTSKGPPPAVYKIRKPGPPLISYHNPPAKARPEKPVLDKGAASEDLPPTQFVSTPWDDTSLAKNDAPKPALTKAEGSHKTLVKPWGKTEPSKGKEKEEPQTDSWGDGQSAGAWGSAPAPASTANKGKEKIEQQTNGWDEDKSAAGPWGSTPTATPALTTTANKGKAPQKPTPSTTTGWQGGGYIETAKSFAKEVIHRGGTRNPKPEPSSTNTTPRPRGAIPPHLRRKAQQ